MKKTDDAITERKRIASWWLRWEDLNWPNSDVHDSIKARAEAMARANVTTAMIFGTHFRWDYLPYFTILHDYLATVAEELGKCGVELWDHHSVNLVHRYDTREEMRHVILHSGPHLPFSPSREAAASWQYRGKLLNDWRMRDVKTGDILYYPQYAAEGFCIRNPDFVDAYTDYVSRLVRETGITGLSADDPVHYMHMSSCACPHCLAAMRERTGLDLPPIGDRSFWFNWKNPAWHEWIDLRFEAARSFFERLGKVLPEGFRLTTCGTNSAAPFANEMAADARLFLAGTNYVNLEMSGNTPPYKNDPITVNVPIASRLVGSSHHRAAAKERGVRCFSTGYGFTEQTANVIWAVNKMLDSDCWLSTLKDRLGLPEHILRTLPNEWDIVGRAFGYEKEHPELFEGKSIGQLGVYFSYETRKHTFFGALDRGYYADWRATLETLFGVGISPQTIFDFPSDPGEYPIVLVPSPAALTAKELEALDRYLDGGGIAVVYGPAAIPGCTSKWMLPDAPDDKGEPESYFASVPNGVWLSIPEWVRETSFAPTGEAEDFREVRRGLLYSPARITDGRITEDLLTIVRKHMKPMPIEILRADGYLITFFETEDFYTVQMLAADFDTDVDHKLDDMRFHRSRVNFINKVEPVGVSLSVTLAAEAPPEVYTPFGSGAESVVPGDGIYTVTFKEKTSYAILRFKK